MRAWIRARIPARIRAKMSFLRYLVSNFSVRLGLESVRLGLFRLGLVQLGLVRVRAGLG